MAKRQYTAMYVREWVDSHGVKQETFRHVGVAFEPPRGGGGAECDVHLHEMPPPEIVQKTIEREDGTHEVVLEQRWRLIIREKREKPDKPSEPEVSQRRPRSFGGG